MQVAVSSALDTANSPRRRGSRSERQNASGVIEISREIETFVELEVAPPVYEDVLPAARSEMVSRVANVTIAVLVAVLLAPVFALIALAIRLTSTGPVFYSQVRVGVDRRYREKTTYDRRGYDHGGKPFMMFKFRTMCVDAEADGRAVWAAKADPRVTPI